MKWTANIIGEEKVWYSKDVMDRILAHLEHFCSVCPYKDSEEDVCNTYCLLDEIANPIEEMIQEEG